MTRKTLTIAFAGLFLVALFSVVDFGYKLYRWHLVLVKVRLQLHGGPMVGMPLGLGSFVPVATRLFWVSLAVAVSLLTGIGALCFSDRRIRRQDCKTFR